MSAEDEDPSREHFAEENGHWVWRAPLAMCIVTLVHGGGGNVYMPLVRFPFEVPGLTDEGDLWLPGSWDKPEPACKALIEWYDDTLGTDDKVRAFLKKHGLSKE